MKWNRTCLVLIVLWLPITLRAQGTLPISRGSNYIELLLKRIKEDAVTIDYLQRENGSLRKKINEIIEKRNSVLIENQNKILRKLENLMANKEEVDYMNNRLERQNNEILKLKAENNEESNKRLELIAKIDSLIDKINALSLEIYNYENIIVPKLSIALNIERQKNISLEELVDELERRKKYLNVAEVQIGGGLGSNYSGLGGSLLFKRVDGFGGHLGVGFMPNYFQSKGSYFNVGINYYLYDNFYLDITYHKLLQHFEEFKYNSLITTSIGTEILLDNPKGLGFRLALGAIYGKESSGLIKTETYLSFDVGLIYAF